MVKDPGGRVGRARAERSEERPMRRTQTKRPARIETTELL